MKPSDVPIFMLGPGKWLVSLALIGLGAMTTPGLAYIGLAGLVVALMVELELE